MVWSLIQGLQICKQILQAMYTAMVHLKLVNVFVEKQVMLPATLPDIESEIICCKDILNNLELVQSTELTINMNCAFDSFEL